jgi:CRP-like cAMP-binding protein
MKRILIVSEEKEQSRGIIKMLDSKSIDVSTAVNYTAAIEQAKKEKPDLIICDINEYKLFHLLSKSPKTLGIPILFLTEKAEKSTVRKSMNLTTDNYLLTPIDKQELLDIIAIHFKRSELTKKKYARNKQGLIDFIETASTFNLPFKVTANLKTERFSADDSIYNTGKESDKVFMLVAGKVKSISNSPSGKEVVHVYKKGDFFGFKDILANTKRSESVVSMGNAEVIVIPKADFLSLVYSTKYVSEKLVKILTGGKEKEEKKLLKDVNSSLKKQVANMFVMLRNKFDRSLDLVYSNDEMASMAGISIEFLLQTLTEFRKKKLIEIDGRAIKIVNSKELEKIGK